MTAAELQDVLFLQFAREPVPGQVKTRMQPVLGPDEACQLHRELVLWTAQRLTSARLGRVELAVTGRIDDPLFQQCEAEGVAAVRGQTGEDLGQRMYNALHAGLQRFSRVVLVGSDCPQLDRNYLASALAALESAEVVLGPAVDGGYVLIGARALDASWFEGIKWGSGSVYRETVARFAASKTCWQGLPPLQDIDRPEDLPLWQQLAHAAEIR